MTLPRLDVISAHWKKVPPLAVSAAAIASVLGVGKAPPKGNKAGAKLAEQEAVSNRQALLDLLGGAGFATEKPAWLKAAETT